MAIARVFDGLRVGGRMGDVAAQVVRGGTVESIHLASAAIVDPSGRLVRSLGDPGLVSFLRSSAKPIQAIAVVESGAADRFGFVPEDLAIVAASHDGEKEHVDRVASILGRIGLDASALRCGRHAPYSATAAREVGDTFTSLHHNCSGKHAGMLAVCVHKGWDLATYLEPDHPLQTTILRDVAQEAGVSVQDVPTATDGCGVPTFALPVVRAARAFARLTAAETVGGTRGESLRRIRSAMLAHPRLVAGVNRLDTKVMTALPGRVWVKAGAEAFYAAGVLNGPYGVAIKVEDGNSRAMGPILVRLLELLGEDVSGLAHVATEPIMNLVGRAVGVVRPAF